MSPLNIGVGSQERKEKHPSNQLSVGCLSAKDVTLMFSSGENIVPVDGLAERVQTAVSKQLIG